ncbi:MAG: hypothetical protein RL368_32 [Pseudomonadota bacterium]
MRLFAVVSLSLAGLFLSLPSYAGQFETFGNYVIHYNAVNTEILLPEIARANQIVRSKNRALLNISIRKSGDDKKLGDKAVPGTVTATVTNLNGQLGVIDMQTIQEQDAIYYIGVFNINNEDTLDFAVKVTPENQGKAHEFKFRQQFFTN